jgi:hypothetical protein
MKATRTRTSGSTTLHGSAAEPSVLAERRLAVAQTAELGALMQDVLEHIAAEDVRGQYDDNR